MNGKKEDEELNDLTGRSNSIRAQINEALNDLYTSYWKLTELYKMLDEISNSIDKEKKKRQDQEEPNDGAKQD